jgi:hypothetical protein
VTRRRYRQIALARWWLKVCKRQLAEFQAIYGRNFLGFSRYGEPRFAGRAVPRLYRGPQLVRTVEIMRDVTGNAEYQRFLDLIRRDGFDRNFERHAAAVRDLTFGTNYEPYVDQVLFLNRHGLMQHGPRAARIVSDWSEDFEPRIVGGRRRLNVLEACELVTAKAGLPGPNFEQVVKRLHVFVTKSCARF